MNHFNLNPLAAFLLSLRVADWQAQVDDYNRAYDDEAASASGLVAA